MDLEVDINILVKTFSDRLMLLYKENVLLEAKYQSLLADYNELIETKNQLQNEVNGLLKKNETI